MEILIHLIDLQGESNGMNRAAAQIYGYSASEALGQNINGFIIEVQDINAANEILQRNASGENWTGIFPARNKQCRLFQVLATGAPLYDDSGTLVGIICNNCFESFEETLVPDSLGTKPLKDNSYPSSSWLHNGGLTTTKPDFDARHKPLKSITSWLIPKLDASKNGVYKMITSRVKGISWSWESQQIPQVAGGNEVSRSLSYSTNSDGTSSMGSRSSPRRNFYMETDYFNYDISLNNLTFGEQIGRGSCATVYHGLWCGTDCAIKVFLNFDYSEDLLMQHSFRQEVLLMKRLRHPNVVLFMGAVTSPPHLCIVTEFLPRFVLYIYPFFIARGMNYLHRHNPPIIHRDLKSSNLLVDKNWSVKWMAPEVIRNEPADEKSDVYSFGVVLWELATLKIPWNDLNPKQVIAAVGFMNQRNEIPKDTDPLWASLIESCWHRTSNGYLFYDPRSNMRTMLRREQIEALKQQNASSSAFADA
ncbi:hypothetical protein C5167_023989 [Papaver somniferum]|uniref:non-specific serine/threonine protein kinase n=1 Tax=Papaver somniferum TaxID=3469 RepID=A0A4Y7JRD9_PAPSO|nr:hypothetical protein C5167_023989 [Papaver somniferum]